jgi:hypothetical protein
MTVSTDFIEPNIEFLAEQDGAPERELKAELCRSLEELTAVHRAYLAVVQYSGKSSRSVALCLVAEAGSESSVVPKIGVVFSRMFNPNEYLDIMFVNESQELILSQVCKPFFIQAPKN